MGAIKAGVTVVTFSEKDDKDALYSTLAESKARGLIFSPSTKVDKIHSNREAILHKLMPELHSLYPGDELALKNFPDLKQII
jgi:long-subunit acyl-CoA synthetase (AMP-forming)